MVQMTTKQVTRKADDSLGSLTGKRMVLSPPMASKWKCFQRRRQHSTAGTVHYRNYSLGNAPGG